MWKQDNRNMLQMKTKQGDTGAGVKGAHQGQAESSSSAAVLQ